MPPVARGCGPTDGCLKTGSDGNAAGGQPAGRQHHAADGPALLVGTLAPLQRQVCAPVHVGVLDPRALDSRARV